MKIQCVALDLDRTTLNDHGILSKENKEAIEELIRRGIYVVAASGRAFESLPADILALKGISYAITSNGAAVYDMKTRTCIHRCLMTEESVCRITEFAEKRGLAMEVFIDGKAYAHAEYVKDPVKYGATEKAIPYIQATREPVGNIYEFARKHKEVLDSVDLITATEEEKQSYWKILKDTVSDIYITSSVTQLLEISYKDAGKHTAAEYLLRRLQICPEELAAFGDGDNDIELLQYAGVGIAMENASEKCKKAADHITLSNEENGLAYALKHILKLTGRK